MSSNQDEKSSDQADAAGDRIKREELVDAAPAYESSSTLTKDVAYEPSHVDKGRCVRIIYADKRCCVRVIINGDERERRGLPQWPQAGDYHSRSGAEHIPGMRISIALP